MNFKKIIAATAVSMFLFTGMAMAKDKDPAGWFIHSVTGATKFFPNGHPGEPSQWGPYEGPNNSGCNDCNTGSLHVGAFAIGGGIDYDQTYIPNGYAGGISEAGGIAGVEARGNIRNGTVAGSVGADAGGVTVTNAYRWNPGIGDRSIGVGSSSYSEAETGAYVNLNVDPKLLYYPSNGFASGNMFGVASQGSANRSGLSESPRFFTETDGETGGVAAQGSVGGFYGGANAFSGPDYISYYWWWSHYTDSNAQAGASANIFMNGSSYSDSYRFVNENNGVRTEGMGTYVGARTNVETYGSSYDHDRGHANSGAGVNGGYVAGGIVTSHTTQNLQSNGLEAGYGESNAYGSYTGCGQLNDNYAGSANGGTHTDITTVNGMKGSFVSSHSNMNVTSIGNSQGCDY